MNELFEKLLSSEMLSEETKAELLKEFNAEVERAKAEAVELAVAEAKVDFAKQYAEDKEALAEAIDTRLTALLSDEILELKEDIERFRDLEAESAAKLVEEKEKMSLQLRADMAELVEAIDVFLDESLDAEFAELKESIEEVKKIDYAKNLYESIEATFKKRFFDESGVTKQLEEASREAVELRNKLNESDARLTKLLREKEMARVLEPLQGRTREIMEAILKPVATEKLDEAYSNFIGRVLHESAANVVETKTEKENASASVLAESDTTEEPSVTTKVVTGDTTTVVEHVTENRQSMLSDKDKAYLARIAGITR